MCSSDIVSSSALMASPPAVTIAAPPPAKKRRRRTPASGAADDCFTCRKEGTKCDRRRPYCQQCLDRGQTCSGYKTQLTWGVGVASRGKLRGLSLPIAGSAALPVKVPERRARRKAISVDESAKSGLLPAAVKPVRSVSFGGMPSSMPEFSFDDLSTPMTAPLAPLPEVNWPVFNDYEPFTSVPMQLATPVQTPRSLLTEGLMQMPVWEDLSVPHTASSWTDSDYTSTMDLPATPEELNFLASASLPSSMQFPQSICPSPISPAFSHSMLSPAQPYMMDQPTSYPRFTHNRTTSTMSCPQFWEPAAMIKQQSAPLRNIADPFYDDRDLSALGVYPGDWDPITLMM